jgi:hypothetical protein
MNQKRQAATGEILRRRTKCKKFHAAYLVEIAEFGVGYFCYHAGKQNILKMKNSQ